MSRIGALWGVVALVATAACSDSTGPTSGTRTVQVTPTGSFGPSGTATITDISGPNATLTATLTGFDANSSHSVAILEGTCAAPGSTVLTLPNLTATSAGEATIASTTVSDDAVAAGHAIVFYESTSTTSALIACGDIT